MYECPTCRLPLKKSNNAFGLSWQCPSCRGRAVGFAVLKKLVSPELIRKFWQRARNGGYKRRRPCPICTNNMLEVPVMSVKKTEYLDVCLSCQFIWFDAGEFERLPQKPIKEPEWAGYTLEQREAIALARLETLKTRSEAESDINEGPDNWWEIIPALFGLPVEYDNPVGNLPIVTWSLTAAIGIVSIIAFFNLEEVIANWGFVPAELFRHLGLTFLTSFFLHAGILHLVGNLYFLMVFGDNIEDFLGRKRFLFMVGLAAIVGSISHILADPSSVIPCVGASGGISAVITYYALKFPKARLGFVIRFYFSFRWVRLPAMVLFVLWIGMQFFIAYQQVHGFTNVSAFAHLGGVAVGFLFWIFTKFYGIGAGEFKSKQEIIQFNLQKECRMASKLAELFVIIVLSTLTAIALSSDNAEQISEKDEHLQCRILSMEKLRKLGTMLFLYVNDNEEKYPDNLEELQQYDRDGILAWAMENVEYLGQGKTVIVQPDTPIAFDKTMLKEDEGTNVLFNDSHVEFLDLNKFKKVLSKALGIPENEEKFESQAKWAEGKAAMGTIATAIRAWVAKNNEDGSWDSNSLTYADLGFEPYDLSGKFFDASNFSWVVSYSKDSGKLLFTISATAGKGIKAPTVVTLDQDGNLKEFENSPAEPQSREEDQKIEVQARFLTIPLDADEIATFLKNENAITSTVDFQFNAGCVFDDKQLEELLKLVRANPDANSLSTPAVVAINGEEVTMRQQEKMEYMMEEEEKELLLGTVFKVKPVITSSGKIRVESEFEKRNLLGYEEGLPQTEVFKIKSVLGVPDGGTVFAARHDIFELDEKPQKIMLLLISARRVGDDETGGN